MALIKQKNEKEFKTKRIGITYLIRIENEAPVNENAIEDTGNIHKRIELYNGIVKAKRSGNSVKAHHRHALLDYLGKSDLDCDPTVKACGRCLACALHGFAMVKKFPTDKEKNAMHSSMISFSDMISIETADDCITGLRENMLKSPSLNIGGSPQPFSYERVRAGTHFVGTAYLTLTGRKTMYEVVFDSEDQIKEAFWYGVRAILTNQTYQQTVMTARHDTRFTPLLLIVSEVEKLPADIMIAPDLTKTNLKDMIEDLKTKAKAEATNIKSITGNCVKCLEGNELTNFINSVGLKLVKEVTLTPKKESKDEEGSEEELTEKEEENESN